MTTAQRIAKNFFSLGTGEIISQLIAFGAVVYLARILGAANFGKIVFARSILAYSMLIGNLGLMTLGTREIARNKERTNKYVNNIITLRLVLSVVSFCLLLLFVSFVHKSLEIKYLILLYGLSLFPIALLLEWTFKGMEKMEYVGLSRILVYLVYFVLLLFVIKSPKQLLGIPYLWLIANLVAFIFLGCVFIKQFGKIRLQFNFPFWKELLKQSLPLGFSSMMIVMYHNFDIMMLGFMKGEEVVGWYNAAYKIILFLLGFSMVYVAAIFPIISRYYKESIKKLQFMVSNSIKLMLIVGLPLGVGGTVLAKPIMNLIYGAEYSNGVIALQILIWSATISFVMMVCWYASIACNSQRKCMNAAIVGVITNISLNLLLIPRFSLVGASIATVTTELAVLIYLYLNFQQVTKIRFVRYLWKPSLSAFLMGTVLYCWQNKNLFILILLGMVTYATFMLLLRGITRDEIVALKIQILKKI